MSDNATAPAPKGHNNPPSDTEILSDNLTLRHVHAMRAAEGHLEIVANIPDHFTQENEASFTSDLIKLMQNLSKEMERRRKDEKEPFLRQGQFVDSFFGEYVTKLAAGIAKAKAPLDDWMKRKADAEQAERDATARLLQEQRDAALRAAVAPEAAGGAEKTPAERAEAVEKVSSLNQQVKVAESIAAAPITTMAKTTGRASAAALDEKWIGTITDVDQLELVKLRPFLPLAELQKAVDRYVRQGGRQLAGAEIKKVVNVKVK